LQVFDTPNITAALSILSRLFADLFREEPLSEEELKRRTDEAISNLKQKLQGLPLPFSIVHQIDRMEHRASLVPFLRAEISVLAREVHENIVAELTTRRFLMILGERRFLFEQPEPLFGQKVAERFNAASRDIAAAGRCMALDEWTATVFHLMRAVEIALQTLARRLRIRSVKVKEWVTLLKDIDTALAAIRNRPRTPKRDRVLEYYSQARANIAVFKDAWRNHVMHSRETYDERQAWAIFASVKAFMEELAEGAPR
jgi:HEPN domain-containing protein